MFNLICNLRDKLDGAGAGTNNGHPFTGQVVVMIPLGRVEHLALEAIQAVEFWPGRLVQLARGGNEHVRGELLAVSQCDRPLVRVIVEGGFLYFGLETDVIAKPVFLDAVLHVAEYFPLQPEFSRPVVLRFEGVGVEV